MQLKTTNDIYHHLNSLGLTLNEAEIYVYLLKSGLTLGSHIHKDLSKDKSSTYRALGNLIEHNLAYKVGESRNQKFGANPEENLLTIVETKKNKLDETSLHLKNFLKTIQNQSKSKFKKRNITILEGLEGFDLYMQMRLKSKEKLIREISTTSIVQQYFDSIDQHDAYMDSYIQKRVEKNIFLKGIVMPQDKNTTFDRTSAKWKKEIRLLPKSFKMSATFTTWDDYLGIFSQEKNQSPLCIVIHDPLVTITFNQMYDILWNQSKKLEENAND